MDPAGGKAKARKRPAPANRKAPEAGEPPAKAQKASQQPAEKRAPARKAEKPSAAQDSKKKGAVAASVETTVKRRGLFAKDLQLMMYGYGDAETPYKETIDLVEDCAIEYASGLLQQALEHAGQRGGRIQPEDILFLVRKDPRKFARAQELLAMNEEIKKAKKAFDADDAIERDTMD